MCLRTPAPVNVPIFYTAEIHLCLQDDASNKCGGCDSMRSGGVLKLRTVPDVYTGFIQMYFSPKIEKCEIYPG